MSERIGKYILDGSDADLERLLRIADLSAPSVREALSSAGVSAGSAVIDCGCGPIGALAVMAELVGPTGRVVGVEANPGTAQRARSAMQSLGYDNVEVHVADVHDVAADALGGPFDVAYCRCFLMHQPDPRRTLSGIGTLLRPGGQLVAHEPLPKPQPHAASPSADLAEAWDIVQATMRASGADGDVQFLPRWCADAGFEVVATSGFFLTIPAAVGFDLHATTLTAAKDRAVSCGAATREQVDELVARLRAAAAGAGEGWVSSPLYLAVAARRL
jgi:SAM-dependent methyltransferase